ncbi:RadC family protein [Chitinophaga deserti]|uniref:RadC family protein n=1 Tax=Chitinophaga deserti TaxID=2164099 RepID=UPI000D6DBBED|nr:DNA repair protein RadC [Chitinophaga deserti]
MQAIYVNPSYCEPAPQRRLKVVKRRRIKEWPEDDRPREKMLRAGPAAVSITELLAIIINSGTPEKSALDLARDILGSCGNDLRELERLDMRELRNFRGIGAKKAATILAALELCRRRQMCPLLEKPVVSSIEDAADYLRPLLAGQPRESFYVLFLNHANKVVYQSCISTGGITSTTVDPRVVFQIALQHKATRILLSHNHPSGTLQPSKADINITRKLQEGGRLLDIEVLDHLIVSENGYHSLREDGVLRDLGE